MLYSSLIRTGVIPQDIFSCLQVCSSGEHPTIRHPGRYLDIMRAVFPERLTVMMALALRSMAVIQVAWEIAVVMLGACSLLRMLNCWL